MREGKKMQVCYDCKSFDLVSVWREGYWYCDWCGNKTKGRKWVTA